MTTQSLLIKSLLIGANAAEACMTGNPMTSYTQQDLRDAAAFLRMLHNLVDGQSLALELTIKTVAGQGRKQ